MILLRLFKNIILYKLKLTELNIKIYYLGIEFEKYKNKNIKNNKSYGWHYFLKYKTDII